MQNKGLGCLLFIVIMFLLVSVVANLFQFAALVGVGDGAISFIQPKPKFSEALVVDGASKDVKDKIVRIDLTGIIASGAVGGLFSSDGMDVDSTKRALEQAADDDEVKAIVLAVNSPGGEVTASDTIYNAVKTAAKKKPVVVYMDAMAASGGYYLSCGSNWIVANETTLTGSIGVIIQTLNYSQAFGKVGLESLSFVSGNFKDTLSGGRPMREDEKAYIQGLVLKMYDKFVGIVAEARKISPEALKSGVADGRVLTGKEAMEAKLVDQVGYIEDAYAKAKELGKSSGAMVVKYQRGVSLTEIFTAFGKAQESAGTMKVDVSDRLLPRLEAGRLYLLPAHMAP